MKRRAARTPPDSTGTPRLRLQDSRSLARLAVSALILVVIVTSVLALRYLRSQAEARIAVSTQNLAKSMVLTFDGIIDAIDVGILASADEIARQNASGKPDQREIDQFLEQLQKRLPVVPILRGTNASGDVIHGAGLRQPAVNVAERPYFSALRDAPPPGLYVSKPTFSKIINKWTWLFARRITNRDGSFGGVTYGVLEIGQIEAILAKINLDAGGSIAVRHAGLEMIAGRLGSGAVYPLKVGDTRVSPDLLEAQLRNPARGTYVTSRAKLSADERTFSYERSEKYGFYVGVGELHQVAMAEWVRQVWLIAGMTVAVLLLAIAFMVLMERAWRRQERDLAAVRQSQESLREAHEIADIGSLSYEFDTERWTSSDIFDEIAGIGDAYPRDLPHLLQLVSQPEQAIVREYLTAAVLRHLPFDREQTIVRGADGQQRWVHARGKVCIGDDQRKTLVCTIQDITERKRAESEILRLAYYDVLTELPNRRLLLDRLAQAMTANTGRDAHGALLLIDLDNFKTLNDTQGHGRGDLLLKAVGQCLLGAVRATDTVARFGGDEFVVLIANLAGDAAEASAQAASMGEKIRQSLSDEVDLDGFLYAGTPSIGITLFRGHELGIEELAKRADMAMYQAKAAGRNAVHFFDPHMQAAAAARVALESDLRQAIIASQFQLYYQAQVDGAGRYQGAEVLLRWRHPSRALVSPAEFIPLAEESGLILPLGHWVLQTACIQLSAWADDPATSGLSLAVNVSARQFRQADFVAQVTAVLAHTRANPRRLKLELTEGLLLEHTAAVIETIAALKGAGVSISLDDFGTGYSSLSYLKRLPLDQLKIDQSFVREVLTDASDAAIVRTIIALGHSLGLEVIAEGVETEDQRDFLAGAGCLAYQGYLFGRPLPLADFEAALRAQLLAQAAVICTPAA